MNMGPYQVALRRSQDHTSCEKPVMPTKVAARASQAAMGASQPQVAPSLGVADLRFGKKILHMDILYHR